MTMQYKIIRSLLISSTLLVIPFIASMFVDGWNWSISDFVYAWIMFSAASIAFTFMFTSMRNFFYKIAMAAAIVGAFTLVWVNGAVGIIGESDSNAMYLGVLAVFLLGTAIARLQAAKMSTVLYATALAQFLVPVMALLLHEPDFAPGVLQVFVLNGGWVILFLFSAIMFKNAAERGYRAFDT